MNNQKEERNDMCHQLSHLITEFHGYRPPSYFEGNVYMPFAEIFNKIEIQKKVYEKCKKWNKTETRKDLVIEYKTKTQ